MKNFLRGSDPETDFRKHVYISLRFFSMHTPTHRHRHHKQIYFFLLSQYNHEWIKTSGRKKKKEICSKFQQSLQTSSLYLYPESLNITDYQFTLLPLVSLFGLPSPNQQLKYKGIREKKSMRTVYSEKILRKYVYASLNFS